MITREMEAKYRKWTVEEIKVIINFKIDIESKEEVANITTYCRKVS